jgi:gliding motility associated protien GldN
MKLKSLLFFTLNFVFIYGQKPVELGPSNISKTENGNYPGVIDGVYTKRDVLSKKRPIPYEFVRENDYVWGKRTWSYIDLREKINHPLYFPHELLNSESGELELASQGRYSLYYILSKSILEQKIWGFFDSRELDPGAGVFREWKDGDGFQYPCKTGSDYKSDAFDLVATVTKSNAIEKTNGMDADGNALPVFVKKGNSILPKKGLRNDVSAFDPNTETMNENEAVKDSLTGTPMKQLYMTVTPKFVQPKQIVKYILKEDWFFDKERSILDVRTIGLAPVIYEDSSTMKEKILFWVYFPQARDVLKNYYVYDAKSTVGGNTFDHLFMTRRFNAVVYKESTLYDRKIEDYRFGADALYESEKVKNTIRTFEHDVWNF